MDGMCRTDEEVDDAHLCLDDLGLVPWCGQNRCVEELIVHLGGGGKKLSRGCTGGAETIARGHCLLFPLALSLFVGLIF